MNKTVSSALALMMVLGSGVVLANDATIDQSGDGMTGTINQDGNNNFADLDQDEFVGGTPHEATIDQNGDDNTANVGSQGSFNGNTVTLVQEGNENEATIDQLWGGNEATVTQEGNLNDVNVQQRGSDGSSGTVTQLGDENFAELIMDSGQTGSNPLQNDAELLQDGDLNRAEFEQKNGSSNQIYGAMIGNENKAHITQDGSGNVVEGPSSDVPGGFSVVGDNNTLDITQTGMGNTAYAQQVGNTNTATITQQNNMMGQ